MWCQIWEIFGKVLQTSLKIYIWKFHESLIKNYNFRSKTYNGPVNVCLRLQYWTILFFL